MSGAILRVIVQMYSPLDVMVGLHVRIVLNISILSQMLELVIIRDGLLVISRTISAKLTLVMIVRRWRLARGAIPLLVLLVHRWHRTSSVEKKCRINLVNVHTLRPGRVIIGEPIGAIHLRMVHCM